jgi:hypothetical protein
MNMHLTPLESNFILTSSGTWMNATQPKTHKWLMEGLYPHKTFFGVILKITFGRDSILDTWCSYHCFCLEFMIHLHMLQHILHIFNKVFNSSFWLQHFTLVLWSDCLLHNGIFLVEHIENFRIIFPTFVTFDRHDLLWKP